MEALNWDGTTARYENYLGYFLASATRNVCYQDPDNQFYLLEDDYQKQDFTLYLASASSVIAGTWSVGSVSVAPGSTTTVGGSRSIVSGVSFTRTIGH